jgi:hypothetical protein
LIATLIIVAIAFLAFSPSSGVTTQHMSMSSQVIPQNTTISLTSWADSGAPLSISWSASSPVYVYILNQTQRDALLLQHTTGGQALLNFTGAPTFWADRYYQQKGNATLNLPQAQYYFFAGSNTQTVLETFGLVQTQQPQQQASSSQSQFSYLFFSVFIAVGALLIILAFSILTRRVWR